MNKDELKMLIPAGVVACVLVFGVVTYEEDKTRAIDAEFICQKTSVMNSGKMLLPADAADCIVHVVEVLDQYEEIKK